MSKVSNVEKVKLQTIVSADMAGKVNLYADKLGVSVSALCAMLIGQGIMSYEKTYEILDSTVQTAIKEQIEVQDAD